VLGVPSMLPEVAFNDMTPSEQERWSKGMTHTSVALFATPSGYMPWAHGVPSGYIFCTKDNALPLAMQQQMASQLEPAVVKTSINSGHCPHLSMPDDLVAAIGGVKADLERGSSS